jgi:hypothetical protein
MLYPTLQVVYEKKMRRRGTRRTELFSKSSTTTFFLVVENFESWHSSGRQQKTPSRFLGRGFS